VRSRGDELPSLRAAIIWSVIGTLVAFLFSSVTDIWVYQTAPAEIPLEYFTTIIPDLIFGVILLPILYTAYKQFETRSGR
jgi:heme/copper-type cytochrome/quinol oxidase subunit 2